MAAPTWRANGSIATGVDAIVDVPNSAVALAVSKVVQQNKNPLLIAGGALIGADRKRARPNTCNGPTTPGHWRSAAVSALAERGGKSWFFVTADYAFGHALEKDAARGRGDGGKVIGAVRTPIDGTATSRRSCCRRRPRRRRSSALANARRRHHQLGEAGARVRHVQGGQHVAATGLSGQRRAIAMGLKVAQGLQLTEAFYWDMNDGTRDFERALDAAQRTERYPTMIQAGVYGARCTI